MTPLTNVTLSLDKSILPGSVDGCRSAKIHTPGKEDLIVPIKPEGNSLTVIVPEVDLWAIVELRWQ